MRLWTLFCALPLCVPLNADSLPAPEAWNWHAQATLLAEANGPFHAAYSGPASAYGIIARTEAAVFQMINDQGGVGGRKIVYDSLDDGFSPPRTVDQVRRAAIIIASAARALSGYSLSA